MYKTRGKPEDPWNRAAVEKEKSLADAIHVNQIQRNGLGPRIQTISSTLNNNSRLKELAKRRQNYEEFKEAYQEALKKSNAAGGQSLEELRYKEDMHNAVKRFVSGGLNDRRNNEDTKRCHKPAMLRAPQRTVKTIKVEVPARYKEEAIFRPPKSGGEGEMLTPTPRSVLAQKFNEIEKLKEELKETEEVEYEVKKVVPKELEDVNLELDLGNAQLEHINKILEVTRALGPVKEEEEPQEGNKLYNVQTPHHKQVDSRKDKKMKVDFNKKKRLMLTLNDVSQRIQRMQEKFFNGTSPQYKSVKNFMNRSRNDSVQVLYQNTNYPVSDQNNPSNSARNLPNKKELMQYPQPQTPKFTEYIETVRNSTEEFTSTSVNDVQNSPTQDHSESSAESHLHSQIRPPNSPKKSKPFGNNLYGIQEEEDDEDITIESVFKPKLQQSILKSTYLTKEFDRNLSDVTYNTGKKSLIEKNPKSVQFPSNPMQKYREEKPGGCNKGRHNKGQYTPVHYMLKGTLYCAEEK